MTRRVVSAYPILRQQAFLRPDTYVSIKREGVTSKTTVDADIALRFPLPTTKKCLEFLRLFILVTVDRDSSVGISTRWELNGPRIETRWGRDFPHSFTPAQRPTQPPAQWETFLFSEVKTAGAWRWPPIPPIDEVKERVELYLYSASRPSWPVLGWALPILSHNLTVTK
jgi:hypothetical protein